MILYIALGLIGFVLLTWLFSFIQIRVWLHYIEKLLQMKSTNLKQKQDGKKED